MIVMPEVCHPFEDGPLTIKFGFTLLSERVTNWFKCGLTTRQTVVPLDGLVQIVRNIDHVNGLERFRELPCLRDMEPARGT